MIDAEIALVYKLTNAAAVTALIGSRMHPLRLPDTPTFPCITYKEIDAPIVTTHDETAANALVHSRYQLDCWASGVYAYANSVALAKAVFVELEGFSGIVTKGAETFNFQSITRVDRRADNDAETGLFWISQDFTLWYQGG
jgi:hypothetical protein